MKTKDNIGHISDKTSVLENHLAFTAITSVLQKW